MPAPPLPTEEATTVKTKHVEITAEKHTHGKREYKKGAVILDMRASQADRLIEKGRAKEADPARVKELKKEA